jgi:hypothetical protein
MADPASEPKFKVKFSTTVPDRHPVIYSYFLKAEVTEATGISDHLFVFQRTPENNEGDAVDRFIQIASPLDIEEIPEDAPDFKNNMPYFRRREVELWFRNVEDLELARKKMDDDLRTLSLTYKVLNGEADKEDVEDYG